ncbi:MAG: hypothetical protein PHN80_16705 [Hespellia sp.]|nr:hypothetical protein [Hespellia sp.]
MKYMKSILLAGLLAIVVFISPIIAYAANLGRSTAVDGTVVMTGMCVNPMRAMIATAVVIGVAVVIYLTKHIRHS